MIIPEGERALLKELKSAEDFDENVDSFSKYFGKDETLWKCSNKDCKKRENITGRELYILDKEGMVAWQKFGPLTVVVFPLCHHCGSSLAQEYAIIIEDTEFLDTTGSGLTGANDDFGPVHLVH